MILINLLPHREEKRRRRKQAFFAGLALSAIGGLVIAALGYLVLMELTAAQQARNEFLQAEITRLDTQIKDIASLKSEIEGLKARQKVVEDFQIDRNMPVHLLNELVKQTPEGIYLTLIRQDGQNITVSGLAQTNERVSEFLRNTAYNSPWLQRPELVEIKAATLGTQAGRGEQRRLFDFSVKLTLKRPQDKDPLTTPAVGAEAAMPAASAASGSASKPS
ncbi:MAG: PilN domain-containing protein [Leptothrix sp. (in: b-proteobacteria)]